MNYINIEPTADLERSFKLEKYWLTEEDFPRLETKTTNLVLRQLYILAWS